MLSEGVLSLLISMLGNPNFYNGCFCALSNIFYRSGKPHSTFSFLYPVMNKRAFVKEEGFPVLLEAIQNVLENEKSTELATLTLRNLCCNSNPYAPSGGILFESTWSFAHSKILAEDHRYYLADVSLNFIPLLTSISTEFPKNAAIQENLLWIFLNYSLNSGLD